LSERPATRSQHTALHFAVFELNADHKWWQGRAVDHLVFKNQG
jgi:hypothetical protein